MTEAGMASHTHSAYNNAWSQFNSFLVMVGLPRISTTSWEGNLDKAMTNFIAHSHRRLGWKLSTIKSKLAGVKHHLKSIGFQQPLYIPGTIELLRGLERHENRLRSNAVAMGVDPTMGRTSKPPVPAMAIAVGCQHADKKNDPLITELATAQLTAFWLLLRKSEVCPESSREGEIKYITPACVRFLHLGAELDDWRSASSVSVYIPNGKSKRNEGVVVTMPTGLTAKLDLVTRLGKYLEEMKKMDSFLPSQPLFPNITSKKLVKFMRKCISTFVQDREKVKRYTLHSLRHGGATALSEAGLSPEALKAHGRWSSDAYLRYVQSSMGQLYEAAERVTQWVDFLHASTRLRMSNMR